MGSEPGDKTKTSGIVFDVSSYSVLRWIGGLSTNWGPRFFDTKSITVNITYIKAECLEPRGKCVTK